MKICPLLIFLFFQLPAFSQGRNLSGVVTDADNQPMVNCNAFISNSGIGTVTDESGAFRFMNFANGSFSLVVSYAGYETYTLTFAADQLPLHLNIRLRKKVLTMTNVTVQPPEKFGWERWGSIFRKCFLGESVAAIQCEIENPDVLTFYRRDTIVEAIAAKQLVISNHYLGYRIKYQLEQFEFDLKNQRIVYMGYPLFEELDSNYAFPAKYARRRVKAYQGSLTHFLRSLYQNRLSDEGFEVRRMVREIQVDTVRHPMKHAARRKPKADHVPLAYRLEMHIKEYPGDSLLTRDSLLVRDQSGAPAQFRFEDFLKVNFFREPEAEEYRNSNNLYKPLKSQVSYLFISNAAKQIELANNGFYFLQVSLVVFYFFPDSMSACFGQENRTDDECNRRDYHGKH